MINCSTLESITHMDAMVLPSSISWVRSTSINQTASSSASNDEGQIVMKAQTSRLQTMMHHVISEEDGVWWGVIRRHTTPSTHETFVQQPPLIVSTSSSLSSWSSEEREEKEDHGRLLDNKTPFELTISSILKDECTPEHMQKKSNLLQKEERLDSYKGKPYLRDLLTDDLRMFQEHLQMSISSRSRASTRIDLKLLRSFRNKK